MFQAMLSSESKVDVYSDVPTISIIKTGRNSARRQTIYCITETGGINRYKAICPGSLTMAAKVPKDSPRHHTIMAFMNYSLLTEARRQEDVV